MILLLLLLYSIVYSMLLLIKTLPAGKQSLPLSFKTQVIQVKTFQNKMYGMHIIQGWTKIPFKILQK